MIALDGTPCPVPCPMPQAEQEREKEEEQRRQEDERVRLTPPNRRRKTLRKVIETEKEPVHEDVGPAAEKELVVTARCAYAAWEVGAPELLEAGVNFKTTKMYQQRSYSFPFINTSTVEMKYWWAIKEFDEV